jgi:hypothetical protein
MKLHGITSQKTVIFRVTAMRILNLTMVINVALLKGLNYVVLTKCFIVESYCFKPILCVWNIQIMLPSEDRITFKILFALLCV